MHSGDQSVSLAFARVGEANEQTNFQVAGLQYEILIVTNTKYAAMQHVVAKHTASCHGTIRWHRDAIGSLVKNCFPCLVLELTNYFTIDIVVFRIIHPNSQKFCLGKNRSIFIIILLFYSTILFFFFKFIQH